jgi:hypothetical protein|tara:strand:- start:753 stop:926 length:174 start_codon:yes stop_codon:yes gene_type:complete
MSSIIPDSIRQKEKHAKERIQINRTFISPKELEAVLTSKKEELIQSKLKKGLQLNIA